MVDCGGLFGTGIRRRNAQKSRFVFGPFSIVRPPGLRIIFRPSPFALLFPIVPSFFGVLVFGSASRPRNEPAPKQTDRPEGSTGDPGAHGSPARRPVRQWSAEPPAVSRHGGPEGAAAVECPERQPKHVIGTRVATDSRRTTRVSATRTRGTRRRIPNHSHAFSNCAANVRKFPDVRRRVVRRRLPRPRKNFPVRARAAGANTGVALHQSVNRLLGLFCFVNYGPVCRL